jgi:hypothetical protein
MSGAAGSRCMVIEAKGENSSRKADVNEETQKPRIDRGIIDVIRRKQS